MPSPSSSSSSSSMRRKAWVHSPPSLVLLLLFQPFCLLIAFVLLTEPCLNPSYSNNLRSKLGYFSLLRGGIPSGEWKERFVRAAEKSLFGTGVVQVWFTARLNAYIQRAEREHRRIVALLKTQRDTGKSIGVESGEGEVREVGNFKTQLEAIALTLFSLPFVWGAVYTLLLLLGAPLREEVKATAILAAHLTLLIGLPLVHILGLPTPTNDAKQDANEATEGKTSIPNASRFWLPLLTLHPNPTFLLPLYYPLIGCAAGTVAATAALALDWGVAWQTYPYPLLVGSLVGVEVADLYTVGRVLFG